CRINARWPRSRLLLCPLDARREAQFRRARLTAELLPTRGQAYALANQTAVPRRIRRHLSPTVNAPAEARAATARACVEWGRSELVDEAQVLASELLTNAVMHAATEIELTVM